MKELKKIQTSEGGRQYSILIVDDVAKNIQLVAKFLTKEGYNLYFAQNGEATLKQIEKISFDLILLDVMMPGMDGFDVCEKLKNKEKSKDIPVIFLTAKTDEDAIARGFACGGVDYVTKPFTPSELVARVKTHLQLRSREMELRDLNSTKDTLLSVISHDLKTPFFNIMSLGELLLKNFKTFSEDEIKDFIENIVQAARVSHNLLENLLNWTRVQTGKILFIPEPLNLEEIIKYNEVFIQPQADKKNIKCEYRIEDDLEVFADKNMLNTIIRNLITNAIKYSSRGGNVIVKAKKSKKKALVEVKDSGIGMPAESVKQLLSHDSFKTTPGTEQETGSGFGLILTTEFVEKNEGKLFIESTEGKGSTFSFTIPLADDVDIRKEK